MIIYRYNAHVLSSAGCSDMLNAATEKNQELAKEVVAAMSIKAPVYHTNTTEK